MDKIGDQKVGQLSVNRSDPVLRPPDNRNNRPVIGQIYRDLRLYGRGWDLSQVRSSGNLI